MAGTRATPYVPVHRLTQILDEYMEWHGIDKTSLARELAAGTMLSDEAWYRRIYAWYNDECTYVRFGVVDSALSALGWIDRWYTDLKDIYDLAV